LLSLWLTSFWWLALVAPWLVPLVGSWLCYLSEWNGTMSKIVRMTFSIDGTSRVKTKHVSLCAMTLYCVC
jgi:hypothetical protein